MTEQDPLDELVSIKKGNERLRRFVIVLLVLTTIAGMVGAVTLVSALNRIGPPEIERVVIIDIQGDTHQESIECLVDLGIVSGYPDGTYRPSEPVTRGQVATVAVRILEHLADGGQGCPEP